LNGIRKIRLVRSSRLASLKACRGQCACNRATSPSACSETLTVNLTGLTGSTTYPFDGRGRDAAGNVSATLRSGSFMTANTTPPGQPAPLIFQSITASSVVVGWTAATDNVAVVG
jgi:hypothetical protein